MAKMYKTIRALPCHFKPFETGRSLIGECPTLRYGWRVRRYFYHASFTFDDDAEQNNYDHVKEKFDHHFIAKKNVIYERAKFNQRVQGEDELVENFVADLFRLAELCEHGFLKDEMMRDRLVVGLRNDKLSEKLQMNSGLTL